MDRLAGRPTRPALFARMLTVALVCATGVSANVTISSDLFVGIWTPTRSKWEATTPVCVWNEDGGAYRVRVNGLGNGSDYMLLDPGGFSIDYRLRWLRSGTRGAREQLHPGVASSRIYDFATVEGCFDEEPPHLNVNINDRLLDAAPPGIYTDTLFVIIEPI